jgi:hypothetical protein
MLANSETDLTGQKIASGEAKLTANSKLTAQVKAVKQGKVALTATSEITVEGYGEVYDITGEAHVKAVSKLSVTGRKIITGKADIKADSEINVQAKTRRQGKAAAIATSKLTTIGEYIPPYKQVIVTLSIQAKKQALSLQERQKAYRNVKLNWRWNKMPLIGDTIRLKGEFKDFDENYTDPDDVKL